MTQPLVLPLGMTVVNWQEYLQVVKRAVGRAPCQGVDTSGANLSDLAKYTASLAEFANAEETDATGALARPGPHLRHTFYSFLSVTSNAVALYVAEGTDLDVLSTPHEEGRVLIMSGNLHVWKDAVLTCLDKSAPRRVREMFNIIRSCFTDLGLDYVWSEYRRRQMPDHTYFLEYKPK